MVRLLLIATLMVFGATVTVSATNIDSLIQAVDIEKQDTSTVNALIKITRSLRSNMPDSALIFAKKAMFISEAIGFSKGINNSTFHISVIYYYKGNYEKALEYIELNKVGLATSKASKRELASTLTLEGNIYKINGDYDEAIDIYEQCLKIAEDEDDTHLWIVVNNNKANIYRRQGKHGEALKIYFEALKKCDEAGLESEKILVMGNIGLVYKVQKQYDKALSYFEKVLKYHRERNNSRSIGILLNNIGTIYIEQEQFSKALKAHQESLEIREQLGDLAGKAGSLLNIGNIYLNAFSDYEKAMFYAQQGLETNKIINSKEGIASAYLIIAEIYEDKNEPEKAIQNGNFVLDILQEKGDLELKKRTYKLLADNYQTLKDYKQSLTYYRAEQVLQDSIFSQANRDVINELTQQYQSEKQEQIILAQKLNLERQEALLEREAANRLLYIGIIVFLAALGILSFYFIRQKQQANLKLQQLNEAVNAQNEALLTAQSRLKVVNRDLKNFTQMASHDLKEPLRMMSSFATLLKRRNKDLDESSQEYIGFITDAARRMTRMINDMLSYATNNIQVENMSYLNMNDLIASVQSNLQVAIKEHHAVIKVAENLPTIKGQAALIEQVFQNLISNAIKFQEPESIPEIEVSAKQIDDKVIYSVKDNGIGIASENQAQVFQLFKRFNYKYEGSGIGLTTCKKIIELHRGTIELQSTIGEGTTFILTFPK